MTLASAKALIGLRRHTVRVVEHCAEWAPLFAAEAALLREALDGLVLDIQHVGSTAVPGLPAKPILDIVAAIRSRDDIPAIVECLAVCGYLDRGDAGRDGGYLLVKDTEPEVRAVHLHLVEHSDSQWRGYLAFRDLLRSNAGARERYRELKLDLARRFPNDRKSYTAGKHEFIRELLGQDG